MTLPLNTGRTIYGVAGSAGVNILFFGDNIDTTSNLDEVDLLNKTTLPTVAALLWTVPAGKRSIVTSMNMVNTNAVAVTGCKLFIGGTAVTDQLTGSFAIPAFGQAIFSGNKLEIQDSTGITLMTVPLGTATPQPLGVATVGVSTLAAHEDHVHAHGDLSAAGGTQHAAGQVKVTPTGTIASTDVQGALAELDTEKIATTVISTDGTFAGADNSHLPTALAVKTYADSLIAANDALVYKGVRDCSANPNYPAADAGHSYKVSVAGKIGGALGPNVEVGDLLLCLVDGSAAGTQAAVGANWDIIQTNIDGAVTGPAAAVSGDFATFSGVSGKVVQDSGYSFDTDLALAAASATRIASQQAVKAYADTKQTGDATLTALAGLATGADKMPYSIGADVFAQTTLTAYMRTLLDDIDAATALATLGAQPADSDLSAIAALATTAYGRSQLTLVDAAADTAQLNLATALLKGLMSPAQFKFLAAINGPGLIFVTANNYQNLACDGATDDLANLNALYAAAPDGSTLVWPGQNATMVLSGAAAVPAGKHFVHVGGGPGNKTNVLETSLTANHFTAGDWYNTWTGFNFTTNNTTTTGVQALTSGTVLNVAAINTALVPASGSLYVGSAIGWQLLSYSARTGTTVTLSSTGTGSSIAGIPLVFKTAGAAIDAGNLVGIDAKVNTFSYCFNGYVTAGSTANQSKVAENGFLNTINFDVAVDAANWNGIIDSNTMDCTTSSRSLSHCEITQVGSVTGQGNQFIRGQFNLRLGSTTAAYPAGVFGVYFTNCFFDNAGTDAFKLQGISAAQRIKFTSCWFSSAAQKGVNFASTAATLPSDIEFIGCNVYGNGTDGVGGAGVQDHTWIGGQVAGNVTNGFNIAPATGNVYSIAVKGTRIGPTGGFGANGTGINIAAGTYTKIKFSHCDTSGNTTALTLGAVVVATWSKFSITDCPGINPRGAVTPPIAAPVSGTTYTNSTGFRCHVSIKGATFTSPAITINAVAFAQTGLANQIITTVLEPGDTIAVAGTTLVWTWAGK